MELWNATLAPAGATKALIPVQVPEERSFGDEEERREERWVCRSWGDRGAARSRRRMRPGREEQLDLLLEIPGQAARLLAADAGAIPAVPPDGRREQTREDTSRKHPQLKIQQRAETNPGEGREKGRFCSFSAPPQLPSPPFCLCFVTL